MAACAAFGSCVLLLIALLQLDGDVCGYFYESACDPDGLKLDFDSGLSVIGLALSLATAVTGVACAVNGRRVLWRTTVVCFFAAGAVGLLLEILDIPNR